jgi:hypothetical protein
MTKSTLRISQPFYESDLENQLDALFINSHKAIDIFDVDGRARMSYLNPVLKD